MSVRGVAGWVGDGVTGAVLAAAGAIFAVLAWPIPRGEIGSPGPGFLPFVLGLFLVALGVVCASRALRLRDASRVALAERKAVICVLALAGAALGFIPLGFIPTTALFLAVLFAVLAGLAWWVAPICAVLASVILWLVFDRALGLGLPAGILPL